MMRWVGALALLAAIVGILWPVLTGRPPLPLTTDSEETLMFAIGARDPVTLVVPAASRNVELEVLVRVPPMVDYDPAHEHAFGIDATLLDAAGRSLAHWTVALRSRVSMRPDPDPGQQRFAARLVGASDWLTDPRHVSLPLADLAAHGDLHLVVQARDPKSRLLLRGFSRRPASLTARHALAEHLAPLAEHDVGPVQASLGFADLPQGALDYALTHARVRLDAVGRRGAGYQLARVALSGYRRPYEVEAAAAEAPAPVALGPMRWAAFNVTGQVTLRLRGAPGAELRLQDPLHARREAEAPAPRRLLLDARGRARVPLADHGPRSVALWAPTPTSVHVSLPVAQATQRLGEPGRLPVEAPLTPDLRRGRRWRLHPSEPLVFAVEPGQRQLKLALRSLEPPADLHDRVTLRAHYAIVTADGALHGELEGRVRRARFERWLTTDPAASLPASHASVHALPLPEGARAVQLWGEAHLAVRAAVDAPWAGPAQLAPGYAAPLPEDRTWRFAPHSLALEASIQPEDAAARRATAGALWLRSQARIDRPLAPRRDMARRRRHEHLLRPLGDPLGQRVLFGQRHVPGQPLPAASWTEVTQGRRVRVRARQGPLRLYAYAAPAVLGQALEVLVDGAVAARRRLTSMAQSLSLPVPAGVHHLEARGLGEAGAAFVDAAPAAAGPILRRRTAHQIDTGQPHTYRFHLPEDDRATLLLQVLSERPGAAWALAQQVFANRPGAGRFVEARGRHSGRTQAKRPVWFRDLLHPAHRARTGLASRGRAGLSELRIDLPSPAKAGLRTLRLRRLDAARGRLWVRAILLSQQRPRARGRVRVRWARDRPASERHDTQTPDAGAPRAGSLGMTP